ncbi:MAG: MFS transporter [Bacilli bacterium]|nr:MFS transporter [Bacilli bacterium]MBN2877695.1 MFS transporter [Bacilli bacterium]
MKAVKRNAYKRNIFLDYLHMFFRNTNFTHGIWAAYLLLKGYSLIDVGLFEMIFHISSLAGEVPTGVVGDLLGRRVSRMLGILSYFVYIGLMLFGIHSYFLIIIAFVICGLSYTFESGSGDALVYDSLKEIGEENKFMKVNGIREVVYQVATVVVLFLTGWLLEGEHATDFYLTAGLFVIAFVMIFLMKETHIPHDTQGLSFRKRMNDHFVKTWKIVRGNKRLLTLIIIGALLFAPVTSLFIYAQEYFQYLGFSERWMLFFLAFHALSAAIGGFIASKVEQKLGEKTLMLVVPILFAISFWLTLEPNFGFVAFIALGLLESLFYVILFDYMNRVIPSEARASVLSFFGMSFSAVMIMIFPIMGLIGELTSIWIAYLFLAIIVTIVVVFLEWFTHRKKKI